MQRTAPSIEHVPGSLRKLRGFTQIRLCERARISRTTLLKIEAGDKSVALDLIERVAKALRVDTDELVRAMERRAGSRRSS